MTKAREMTDFSHFTSAAIMHRTALKGTKLQAVQADDRLRTTFPGSQLWPRSYPSFLRSG